MGEFIFTGSGQIIVWVNGVCPVPSSMVNPALPREIMDELKLGEDGLWFDQASGAKIEEGVTLINDMLYYDQHRPMLDDNMPKMFVSDACKNLIYSLREWTGADKEHGASKDPIDCCRYVIQEENLLVSTDMVGSKGGGAY